jgi:hypothetical protein
MESIEELKKKIAEYEKRMGIGQFDPTKDAYLVLVDILKQQTEFLREFKLKSKISSDEKADTITYKNAKDLWEGLPDQIKAVNNLKVDLKMEGEEKKIEEIPVSPESLSNRKQF